MVALILATSLSTAPPVVPDRTNFQRLLGFIRPTEQENRWRQVGWRNRFATAIGEAQRLGRPILLWTMNGHPLGCT